MTQIPLLKELRQLLAASVRNVMRPEDGTPVEFEARGLVEQLVPEVYRPLSTALGTTTSDRR
jgi:hypothetical protein